MKKNFGVFILLLAFGILALASVLEKSPTADEVSHHIATGYSFLKTRDFRLHSVAPPLIEELAALPLLFLKDIDLPLGHPSWSESDRVPFGFHFLYEANRNSRTIVLLARIPMILLGVGLGLMIFLWCEKLYGAKPAFTALFFYSLSPTILGITPFVFADIGVSFFILLALWRFLKVLERPSLKRTIWAGVTFGLAQASKFTALYLYPLYFVLAILFFVLRKTRWGECFEGARSLRKLGLSAVGIFLIGLLVLDGTYFFERKPLLANDPDIPEKINYFSTACERLFPGKEAIKARVIDFSLHQPVPFATYVMGILAITHQTYFQGFEKKYLCGRYSEKGWWYYYPAVILFKTELPLLILFLLSFFMPRRLAHSHPLFECFVWIPAALFSAFALTAKIQLGLRYLAPLYPFLFILSGRAILAPVPMVMKRLVFGALGVWLAMNHWMTFPHYMGFFNELVGGSQRGWRYLLDTNVDQGQDLRLLANYLKHHGIRDPRLLYWGSADPRSEGIPKFEPVTQEELLEPLPGIYAVSANYLPSVAWKDEIPMKDHIGNSIFIYEVTGRDLRGRARVPDRL